MRRSQPSPRVTSRVRRLLENLATKYKPLKELWQSLSTSEQSRLSLAYAFRHLARYYFRPNRTKHDPIKQYGIYFTPREVIEFLVELTNPLPNEQVIDPACGSGGFLLQVIAHLRTVHQSRTNLISQSLWGYDIDETCVLITRTSTHLMLADSQSEPSIHCANSLDALKSESFDVVLCNPPAGDIPSNLLPTLSDEYKFAKKSRRYEVAFLELILRIAKPKARIGVIFPEGMLTNTREKPIRQWLNQTATIEAVIGLPRGVFPFTPSRMCAVMMTKRPPRKSQQTLITEVSRYQLREQLQSIVRVLRSK